MRSHQPKNKNGDSLVFKTSVSNVYDTKGVNLPDKIASFTNNINTINGKISSINTQMNEIRELINSSDPTSGLTDRSASTTNICLLKDNKGVVTSNYGFNYTKLSLILESGDYSKYIKNGDWIELVTNDGKTHLMYANIDTYYGKGNYTLTIGHHIDFISKNTIPGSRGWCMRTSYNNNGVSAERSPFLSCTKKYRTDGYMIDALETYYTNNIPSELKSHIVKKYHNVTNRYSSDNTSLTQDTSSGWRYMGYLWLPYEREVHGANTYAFSYYESWMPQYYCFANIPNFKIKYDTDYSTTNPVGWWNASTQDGSNSGFCIVTSGGSPTYNGAGVNAGGPLCFRFQ